MENKTKVKTRYWHENGNKMYETPYVNGKRHGLEIGWYLNGNKHWETEYINDQINGLFIFWYKSEKIKIKETYKKGILHGAKIKFKYS